MPRRPFIPDYLERFIDIATKKGDTDIVRIVIRHIRSIRFQQKCKEKNKKLNKNPKKPLQNKLKKSLTKK